MPALALLLVLALPAFAQRPEFIRVLAFNDFHGAFEPRPDGGAGLRGGAAHLATAIRTAQEECVPRCAVVVVTGGDDFQGTLISNLAYGRRVVDLYTRLGVAAAALGNHEFDWGQDTLRARLREAPYRYLGANVTDAAGRPVPWLGADTIVERGGVRVGIVGFATTATPTTTRPAHVADLRFHAVAPVAAARAKALRARGADLVIAVGHLAAMCQPGGRACRGEAVDVARAGGVDAVVSGHNHAEVAATVNGTPIVQARSHGRALAVVDLPVRAADRRRATRIAVRPVGPGLQPADGAIEALVRAAAEEVRPVADRVVATLDAPLRPRGDQHRLGDLIADAQRAAARADLAVMNNGGIRSAIEAGVVTWGDVYEVHPFGNRLVRLTVRGADLRRYLAGLVDRNRVSVHVSGVTLAFDPQRSGADRLVAVRLADGRALEDTVAYTIAMNDFMAAGGDGLGLGSRALRREDTGIADVDALVAHLRSFPGGRVFPPAGPDRIRAVTP